MSTRTFGEPVKRNEDRRLLTGQALFVDDIELPGMLHVAFLRSQVAHARILKIDVSKALRRPGVVAAAFALFAAFLNAAFGICLGCQLYPFVTRLRRAPASV